MARSSSILWGLVGLVLLSLPGVASAVTWQEIDFIYSNKQAIEPGRDKDYAGLNEPKWYGIEVRDTYSFISEEQDRKSRMPEGWTPHINGWSDFNVQGWVRDRGKMGFGPITAAQHPEYVYGGRGTSFSVWSSHSQLAMISPPIPLTTGPVTVRGKFWVGAANGPSLVGQWTDWADVAFGAGPGGYFDWNGTSVFGTPDVNWNNVPTRDTPDTDGFPDAPTGGDLEIWFPCPPSGCPWQAWSNNLTITDGYAKEDLRLTSDPVGAWYERSMTFNVQADANYHFAVNAGSDHYYYNGDYTKYGTLIIMDNLEIEQGGQVVWSEDFETAGQFVPADFDQDGDVDLTDFTVFLSCFNGPNRPPAQSGCTVADFDTDSDVDLTDFTVFLTCFNGPARPPACP